MSDIEKYLTTTELLDCQGRVQHTLTLMIDGRVKIRRASSTIIVEPSTGHIEPAGSIVPDHVLHAVGELAGQRPCDEYVGTIPPHAPLPSATVMTAPYQEPEFLPWDGRRVPITFVGGYLGAGKTSAINEVLSVADRPIAVVVNDAGAINLDARLIKGCDGDAIELTDGCVCCTSIDDMGAALDTIRSRPEPPDHLVIELSGIAEPDNVTPWGRS
ncbi:cobW, partial [Symbiodinium sp. KB8]